MSNDLNTTETAEMLTDHGFRLRDETVDDAAPDLAEEDLEFQPIRRTGMHWLTMVLIGLSLWGGGFLIGVLLDRALAG